MKTGRVGVKRWLAGLIILFILRPVAAEAVTGDIEVSSPLILDGDSQVSGDGGLLTIRNLSDSSKLGIVADEIHVEAWEARYMRTSSLSPIKYEERKSPDQKQNYLFGASILALSSPGTTSFVAVQPRSPLLPYNISIETNQTLPIAASGPATIRSIDKVFVGSGGPRPYEFYYDYDRDHIALQSIQGSVRVTGDFNLYVWDAIVHVDGAKGGGTFPTGEFHSNDTGIAYDVKFAWLKASLTHATLTFNPGSSEENASAYLDEVGAFTKGTARAFHARGYFRAGENEYHPKDEDVTLEGNLGLGIGILKRPQGLGSVSGSPRMEVSVRGELVFTTLQAAPAGRGISLLPDFMSSPAGQAILAGGLTTLLLGSVFLYRWLDLTGHKRRFESRDTLSAPGDCLVLERRAYWWLRRRIPLISVLGALHYWGTLARRSSPFDDPQYHHMHAQNLIKIGRWRAAARELELLRSLYPNNEDVRYDLARAYAFRARLSWRDREYLQQRSTHELAVAVSLYPRLAEVAKVDPTFRWFRRDSSFKEAIKRADSARLESS